MPDTPIYGITYPCVGDVIDPADFATFAADVEAALVAVDAEATAVLQAPYARCNVVSATAQGVQTTLALTTFNSRGIGVNPGAGTLTVPTAGLYFVSLVLQNVNQNPTMTSRQVTLRRNGVDIYLHKQSTDGTLFPNIQVSGPIPCAAAAVLTATSLWTSSGVALNSEVGSFSAVLLATP